MILIDIQVPALHKTYNFSVDENLKIRQVIPYMTDRILQKEQCGMQGDVKELVLSDLKQGIILNEENTLAEYGMENGAGLMLL